VLPSERTIVLERFRDEIGDWRLCVLSPYGGRVHAAWGLAISARIRHRYGLKADAIISDDGIVLHLPDLDADETESRTMPARCSHSRDSCGYRPILCGVCCSSFSRLVSVVALLVCTR
jgi:Lhr-like helicase